MRPLFERILLTGASGYLGSVLRPALRGMCSSLRLTDLAPPGSYLTEGEEFMRADLADAERMQHVMAGIDAVVHLGGASLESPWETILHANIAGTYNVFEAARRHGVKRFVYASSHHAVGFYRRTRTIGPDEPARPDSRYGASKVFGEALGRLYADKHGMSVIAQRIGVARPEPQNPRGVLAWISERDYISLTQRCLAAPDVHFLVVYGVSANEGSFWNNPAGDAIGFMPRDDGAAHARRVHAATPPASEPPVEAMFQGGWFCGMEFTGDPDRID